jgi:ferrous iron transport protein A
MNLKRPWHHTRNYVEEELELRLEGGQPLTLVEPGERVRLVGVRGCRNASHRLAELGLTPGVELEVLRKGNGGPLLLAVRDSRLALGRRMAQRVIVVPVNGTATGIPSV